MDGWMDEEDDRFSFFFSFFLVGWVGLVGGSILALICFLFWSFRERIVVPY